MTGYFSRIVLRHIDRIWYKISLKKIELKHKINNYHFLLRFHNTVFNVIFAQVIFSMLGASSYNFENKEKYYLHLRPTEGQWLTV